MTQLYRNHSSYPKPQAQMNLAGRTHYVDDDTMRFHHSRVLSAHVLYDGLLFSIVTSDAADMHNTKRVFRHVVFDVFGTVVSRVKLESGWSTRRAATNAMWADVNQMDANKITRDGIESHKRHVESELQILNRDLSEIEARNKAA